MGTLVQPDRSRLADPEEIWRQYMQVFGMLTGLPDWGAPIDHVSFDSDARYAHVLQNLGTGGAQLIKSSAGFTLLAANEIGVTIPTLIGTVASITTINAGTVNTTDLNVSRNTVLGDNAASDTTILNSILTANGVATFNGNVTTTADTTVGNAAGDALTVNATSTFAALATFNAALVANADVTLGNAAGDVVTVFGTPEFKEATTFDKTVHVIGATNLDGALVVGGSSSLGVDDADTTTVIASLLVHNLANTKAPFTADSGNERVVMGYLAGTPMGSDTTPAAQIKGRLYVAPESANDFAQEWRRSTASTVGWRAGVSSATSTADLVFKDTAGTETVRAGAAASAYQLVVTGAFNATGSGTFGAGISAAASSAFTGGVTITTGGLTVLAGGAAVTGAVSSTTTVTGGTGVTATTGDVTATAGNLVGKHLKGNGTAPTVTSTTNWGTTPTVTVSGKDMCCRVRIAATATPGLNPSFTLTFNSTYANTPVVIRQYAVVNDAALEGCELRITAQSTSLISIQAFKGAGFTPTAGLSYDFYFIFADF